jgi:hypothetical protein
MDKQEQKIRLALPHGDEANEFNKMIDSVCLKGK